MLSFKFALTVEEFFDYHFHTTWAAADKKAYRMRYYLRVILLYSIVAILYIIGNPHHNLYIDFSVFGIIAVLYFLLIPIFIRFSIRRRVKEILREPDNQHILKEATINLSETGITDKDDLSESHYEWEAIVKKDETDTCYYLYTNSYHAVVIPKRVIMHPAEKKELEDLFDRLLPLSSEFNQG